MDLLLWCHLRFFNHVFFVELVAVVPSLFRRAAEASLALVRPLLVVHAHKRVEIDLDLFDAGVEGFSERDSVELLLDDLIEPLGAAIGLWVIGFRS